MNPLKCINPVARPSSSAELRWLGITSSLPVRLVWQAHGHTVIPAASGHIAESDRHITHTRLDVQFTVVRSPLNRLPFRTDWRSSVIGTVDDGETVYRYLFLHCSLFFH